MPSSLPTIGILGGMGPNASADFLGRLLRIASRTYGAVQDDEYPAIILNSLALQGFEIGGVQDLRLIERQLVSGVRLLEKAGASFIVIPCNTVHCLYPSLCAAINLPILHIAESTADAVKQYGIQKVGLCASVTTVQTKLYETACRQRGIETLVPDAAGQKLVNEVIEAIMSGIYGDAELLKLKSVILRLQSSGAEGVILGCTELPLAINQKWTDVLLFDSLQILAEQTVERAYETQPKPVVA